MTPTHDSPYSRTERHPELVEQLLTHHGGETFSFVELVLYATEFSEDATEVGDLVDAMVDSGLFCIDDLDQDHLVAA